MSTKTAAQTKKSLRKKLIKAAHDDPSKRAAIFPMLEKMGMDISKLAKGDEKEANPVLRNRLKKKRKSAAETRLAAHLTKLAAGDDAKQAATATKLLARIAKGDKMPPELLEKFKGKDDKDDKGSDKEASIGKVAVKPETEAFARWVMSTQAPMSPGEVQTFVNRTLGIKLSPPRKKRTGPRYQRGDKVEIKFAKHKASNGNPGPYKLYNGKIGTVVDTDGMDALVEFKGERAPVRFEGALKNRGVGIYKYTPPFTITGSSKIEMIYNAGGSSTSDAKIVVDAYKGRARGTEKRAANYYTGYVVSSAMGKKGFYFMGFPQQRMEVGTDGGFRPRSFNPSMGEVLYIGVFNSRPGRWKEELKQLDAAAEEAATA